MSLSARWMSLSETPTPLGRKVGQVHHCSLSPSPSRFCGYPEDFTREHANCGRVPQVCQNVERVFHK